jgi:hypothetical protein
MTLRAGCAKRCSGIWKTGLGGKEYNLVFIVAKGWVLPSKLQLPWNQD